jgi:hypothetical protein
MYNRSPKKAGKKAEKTVYMEDFPEACVAEIYFLSHAKIVFSQDAQTLQQARQQSLRSNL